MRARLVATSADPAGWEAVVRPRIGGWRDRTRPTWILQTVVGAWPLTPARLELYIEKALREAKVHTSWIDQDYEREAGAEAWAVNVLRDDELGAYAEGLSSRTAQIVLGMTSLELTVPGVPDIYQGDELPFFALVDPDNRRPVNFDERRRLLAKPHRRRSSIDPAHARAAAAAPPHSPAGTRRSRRARTSSHSCAAATCSSQSRCRATSAASARPRASGATSTAASTSC